MERTTLKTKKALMPTETLRRMNAGRTVKFKTVKVKTPILRVIASKLKKEGYLFYVSDKGLKNETIVECIKTPEL